MAAHEESPYRESIVHDHGQPPQDDLRIVGRVGFLEGAVKTLTDDVRQVSVNVDKVNQHLNSSVDKLGQEIRNVQATMSADLRATSHEHTQAMVALGEELHTQQQPNWTMLTAAGGGLLTVMGLVAAIISFVLSGHGSSLNDLQTKQDQNQARFAESEYKRGMNDAITRIADQRWTEAQRTLQSLDDKLQREMQLINNTTEARVKSLDEKLQLEFNGIYKTRDTLLTELQGQITELRKWRLDHINMESEFRGRFEATQQTNLERIKRLEQQRDDTNDSRLKTYDDILLRNQLDKRGYHPTDLPK